MVVTMPKFERERHLSEMKGKIWNWKTNSKSRTKKKRRAKYKSKIVITHNYKGTRLKYERDKIVTKNKKCWLLLYIIVI